MESKSGYTAIELIVTIAIIGLLSTIALPSINNVILRYQLKDTAREIASSLRLLRIRAISTNFRTYLDFNPGPSLGDRFYTAFVDVNGDPNDNPPAETEAASLLFHDALLGAYKGTRLPTGVRYGWGSGASHPSSAVTFSGNRAGFNPDGMPNSSGTVYLTNTLNDSYRVIVAAITGRVKIEKWNGSSWK